MLLMFLAFLVDRVQQASCPLFQAALKKRGNRRSLRDQLRNHVRHFEFSSFAQLWRAILNDAVKHRPPASLGQRTVAVAPRSGLKKLAASRMRGLVADGLRFLSH